jgi:superfamily I DNA/RNA helicase
VIQLWEQWRKGQPLSFEEVALVTSYLPKGTKEWPKTIWHESLTKISQSDREFYISLLRNGEKITQEPRININTIHGVKGGESDNVLILTDISYKTAEAMIVNPDAEHRVWYVAVTRAKKGLHIIMPQTKNSYEI